MFFLLLYLPRYIYINKFVGVLYVCFYYMYNLTCYKRLYPLSLPRIDPSFLPTNPTHGLINYIDTKVKCRHLKTLTYKETLLQEFFCLRPPPLLDFWLGWSSNFLGTESDQIQSVNFCRIWSPTGLKPPQPHTVCIYFTLTQGMGKEVESWTRRKS